MMNFYFPENKQYQSFIEQPLQKQIKNENTEVYICSKFLTHSKSQDVSKMQQFNFGNKFEGQIAGKYFFLAQ